MRKKRSAIKRTINFRSQLSPSPPTADVCKEAMKYYVRIKANSLDFDDLGYASVGIPFSCYPRGPRSKRKLPKEGRGAFGHIHGDVVAGGILKECSGDVVAGGISKECSGTVSSAAVKCKRPKGPNRKIKKKNHASDSKGTIIRCKRKTKQENDSSGSEIAVPFNTRFRGQARRCQNGGKTSIVNQGKLDSGTFLNYLTHIWNDIPEEKVQSFAFFDPIWFSLYADEKNRAMVLHWIKEMGTFTKKYILVPIVLWSHWSLLIFCHLGEDLDSKNTTPCMLLLDSLHAIGPNRLEPLIRRLLFDIYSIERGLEIKKQLKKVPLLIPKVPQQRRGEECGYLVLYYINLFLESAPENFSASYGYPYFMKEDWFTVEGLESFYKKLNSFPDVFITHDDSASVDSGDCVETTFS